jgi:hypothetical protein
MLLSLNLWVLQLAEAVELLNRLKILKRSQHMLKLIVPDSPET